MGPGKPVWAAWAACTAVLGDLDKAAWKPGKPVWPAWAALLGVLLGRPEGP